MRKNYKYTGQFGMSFVAATNVPNLSATFTASQKRHTWSRWRLIPQERYRFNAPTRKSHTIDVPGGSGLIDLAPILSYYPLLENRTGTFTFIVPEFYLNGKESTWPLVYSDMVSYLQGRPRGCILDEDPSYAYVGYFDVGQLKSEENYSTIDINYDVYPYKITENLTESVTLSDTAKTVTINVGEAPVTMLKARVANGTGTIEINGYTDSLQKNDTNYAAFVDPVIAFNSKKVSLKFKGSGTATVTYNKGWL